jgi:hypothetical protein
MRAIIADNQELLEIKVDRGSLSQLFTLDPSKGFAVINRQTIDGDGNIIGEEAVTMESVADVWMPAQIVSTLYEDGGVKNQRSCPSAPMA